MNGKAAVKIINGRLGSNGAKLFFNVAFGSTDDQGTFAGYFTLRDCVLRESKDSKDYVAFPSKPRTKKGDAPNTLVIQQDPTTSKPIYDQIGDLYFEKPAGAEKGSPTEAAWEFRKQVIDQAVALYGALSSGNAGRGSAAPVGIATSMKGTESPNIFGDDDSDDLPF
jgi:hypothetical protein